MNEGRCLPRRRDYDPILPYQELLDWNEVPALCAVHPHLQMWTIAATRAGRSVMHLFSTSTGCADCTAAALRR